MTKEEIKNISLLVDFENFSAKPDHVLQVEILYRMLNLPKDARFIIRRAYGDWGQHAKHKNYLRSNSFDLVEMPMLGRGKNSADIKMALDALEIALTKEYIDTFVVVTGDSDFTPLLSKLRELDRFTIVIGKNKATSKLLGNFCDEIIYYDNLFSKEVEVTDMAKAYKLLGDAVAAILNDNKTPLGSLVKSRVKQLSPSFSETEFGFSQWKMFLEQAREDGVVNLVSHESGDYLVEIPKVDEVDRLKQVLKISDEFCVSLHRAIENAKGKDGRSLFSRINEELQKLESDFSIRKFGISKSKGFSAFVRLLSEQGLVQIYRSGNSYSASATKKLQAVGEKHAQ